MQLIHQLGPTPRGVSCGAVRLVARPTPPFRARCSAAIRTAVVDRATGEPVCGAGGGISRGSDAAREPAEPHAKAAILAHDAAEHRLVETLAFLPHTGLRFLHRHLARMADSAEYFGFRFHRDAVVAVARHALAGRAGPARVRILLDRAGDVAVDLDDLPAASSGPVRLAVDDDPVDEGNPWLQHKTTRRAPYVSRALRHPEADDVVLVNRRGEVTETTIANVALRLDGRWSTPPTSSGCLPGVARARLLQLGRLRERSLTVDDLIAADAIAVVNSLRGWRQASLLNAPAPHAARAVAPLPGPVRR